MGRDVIPREQGTCVSFFKTSGFIRPDAGGRNVFVHYSDIESDEPFRELTVGARYTFARGVDFKGRETAVQVERAA